MTAQNMHYRQLTWQALQAAGLTPGDAHEFYQQVVSKNSGITSAGDTKAGWSVREQGRDADTDAHAKKLAEDNQQFEEKKQQSEMHLAEQRRQQEAWLEDQREQERLAALKRPDEERQNARIMGLPMQMTGFLLGIGLAGEAVEATGNMLSPGLNHIGDQMELAGGSANGSLLNEARQSLGVSNPPMQDALVTGPNQIASVTPGEMPEMNAPDANMTMQRNPSLAAMPGLSGPSFGPKRG